MSEQCKFIAATTPRTQRQRSFNSRLCVVYYLSNEWIHTR